MFPSCLILNPEVLAQAGLCCPCLHHLSTSSATLIASVPFPDSSSVIRPVFGIQGSSCLTARVSGLSLLNFPGLLPSTSAGSPTPALPSFLRSRHWSSSSKGKLLTLHYPATNFPQGGITTVSPFAFATALLFARLLDWSDLQPYGCSRLSLLLPGFQ